MNLFQNRMSAFVFVMCLLPAVAFGAGTITGKVMTAQIPSSGLAGYTVRVMDENWNMKGADVSGADGSYAVSNLPENVSLLAEVYPPGPDELYFGEFFDKKENFDDAERIRLGTNEIRTITFSLQKAPDNAVEGMVSDASGNGVDYYYGKKLYVTIKSIARNFEKSVEVNPGGSYIIRYIKEAADYYVVVYTEELPRCTAAYYHVSDPPETSVLFHAQADRLAVTETSQLKNIGIRIDPSKARKIEGTVTIGDVAGADPSGCGIYVYAEDMIFEASTQVSASGYYIICGVPPSQSLIVTAYPPDGSVYYPKSVKISVAGGDRANVDFTFQPGASVSGSVKTVAGQAISDGEVYISSSSSGTFFSQPLTADGTYRFSNLVPAGDYVASVFAKGYPASWYKNKSDEQSADKIDLFRGNAVIDFILNKGGVITGKVFIGDRFHPAPAGVYVYAWSPSREIAKDAFTDANGGYEIIGLDPGAADYMVSVHHQGHPPMYYRDNLDGDPFNDTVFREGEAGGVAPSDIPRNFVLPPGVSIKGTVTYFGAPVSNIRVEAVSFGTDPLNNEFVYGRGETFSAKELTTDGFNYVISGLRPGPVNPITKEVMPAAYKVSVQPPVEYAQFAVQEREVQITDKDVLNINFELTKQEGRTISGTIRNLPLNDVIWINAWSESLRSGKGMEIRGTGNSYDYEITSLIPASDYVADISSDKYPRMMYNNKIDISEGNKPDIDFDLPDAASLGYIAGTVTFPEGSVIGERVWVEAASFSTGSARGAEVRLTDPGRQAAYKIAGLLKAKDYIVYADSPKYTRTFYNGNFREIDADPVDISTQSRDDVHFSLSPGASVSGKVVNSEGTGLPGIDVHAWSESTKTGAHSKTGMNGTYQITGLISAPDYIVEATDWKNSLGCFFYHLSGTVRDPAAAERLSTESRNPDNIDIKITAGLSIKGTVKSWDGKALNGVWVSAWSETLKAGNGMFSLNDGSFEIRGLPTGYYDVTAEPEWSSEYLPQKKTGVASGSADAAFSLSAKKGTFTLSGTVKADGKGIPGVFVELHPDAAGEGFSVRAWSETGADGTYRISRLSAGNYTVFVNPPPASGYAHYSAKLTLSGSMTHDADLKTERIIGGKVVTKDGLPISGATVQVYSGSANFWQETLTDKNGAFRITQVPTAADYTVTAMKDGYCDLEKSVALPETGSAYVTMTLWVGGSIYGTVKNSTGAAVSDVQVEVFSASLKDQFSFVGTAWTDSAGSYAVKGLRKGDALGGIVADYMVLINAFTKQSEDGSSVRYSRQLKTNVNVGDKVDFIADQAASGNEISGVITNFADINSVDGDYAAVDIFNSSTGRFDYHMIPDSQGHFRFVGLDQNIPYYIGFGIYIGENETPLRYQWAGTLKADSSVDNQPAEGSVSYLPGKTDIQFSFDLVPLPVKKSVITPGTVQNLRIIGLPAITAADSDLQIRSALQNVTRSPSGSVTNSPTVTVTWDAVSEDERYYCIFNREPGYPITKRNSPEPAITTRKTSSSNLSGDYLEYFFHIAVEDNRGRIGETTTLSFFVDTVAPKNPTVRALSSETAQTGGAVILELGATGATEMYISNTNYGEGGQWEKLAASKQWTLSDTSDASVIYVQFRDDARNTVNALTTISTARSLSNVLKILQILTGGSGAATDATGDSKMTLEDAVFVLQEIAEMR